KGRGQMHRAAAPVMAGAAAAAMGVALGSCRSTNASRSFGGSFGSGGGGPIDLDPGVACTTSAACLPGEVCCEPAGLGAGGSCHGGACPMDMLQLCGMSAECLQAGYVCPPTTQTPIDSPMVCGPAEGGETDAEASLGDGSDGPSPSDAPVSDGPSPKDGGKDDGSDTSEEGGGSHQPSSWL